MFEEYQEDKKKSQPYSQLIEFSFPLAVLEPDA